MKRRNEPNRRRLGPSVLGGSLALLLFASGCGEPERTEKTTGGETHFLKCAVDADCASLSSSHRCVAGFCQVDSTPVEPDAGSGSPGSTSGVIECAHGQVDGNGVVVLGDTFMALTHQVTSQLENLARAHGALAAGEHYRDQSTVTNNALGSFDNGIANQYSQAFAYSPVHVVLMDGGGSDVLLGSCASPLQSCPAIVQAVAGAKQLLTRMAADGVSHVVYAYYPDPMPTDVRAKLDAMRPLMQAACNGSAVRCHWLDLRTVFAGHYGEYLAIDGLDPSAPGSQASATAIWDLMQRECIAQ